jgi:Uma2 family endonuclease
MSAEPQRHLTAQEYLAFERASEERHEFWDGEVVAMAGASPAHNGICWNLAGVLHPQLRGADCRGFVHEMRVRLPATNRYVYPDLVVVCGEPVFEEDDLDVLSNPALVVEVLSPSTEERDRGIKLFGYRGLPSLKVCLLVAQDRVWVEHWTRQPDGRWLVAEIADPAAIVDLPEIGCTLPLAEIYAGIVLNE